MTFYKVHASLFKVRDSCKTVHSESGLKQFTIATDSVIGGSNDPTFTLNIISNPVKRFNAPLEK